MDLRHQFRGHEAMLNRYQVDAVGLHQQIDTAGPGESPEAIGGPAKRAHPVVVPARDREANANSGLEAAEVEREGNTELVLVYLGKLLQLVSCPVTKIERARRAKLKGIT